MTQAIELQKVAPDEPNPEELGFWRAMTGNVIPVPDALWIETKDVPNRDDIILEAVESLFAAARQTTWKRKKAKLVFTPAIDVIAVGMGLDPKTSTLAPRRQRRLYWAMCSLALRLAQQDVRYWGVRDTSVERYCGKCRQVIPTKEFRLCEYTCDSCTKKMGRGRGRYERHNNSEAIAA